MPLTTRLRVASAVCVPQPIQTTMGLRFRKSVKLAPGVRINFSKSGVSASIGVMGLTYNTRGKITVGIPGSGLSYEVNLKKKK